MKTEFVINKTWTATMSFDRDGELKNTKTGKVFKFRLNDYGQAYLMPSSSEVPYSVLQKTGRAGKKWWIETNNREGLVTYTHNFSGFER